MTEGISTPSTPSTETKELPTFDELKQDIATLLFMHDAWKQLVDRDHDVCIHLRGAARKMEDVLSIIGKVRR